MSKAGTAFATFNIPFSTAGTARLPRVSNVLAVKTYASVMNHSICLGLGRSDRYLYHLGILNSSNGSTLSATATIINVTSPFVRVPAR